MRFPATFFRQSTALFLTLFIFTMTGCASITSGKHQAVSINAICEGEPVNDASCTLMNDKGSWHVKTPGSVMIQKAYGDLAVDCKKGGAVTSSKFKSKNNAGVWGNILAGGLIGYAVDASSGAGFDYPSPMTVTMNPPCPGKANALTAKSSD